MKTDLVRRDRSADLMPLLALQHEAERRITVIRGQHVMLDGDLAELYGVETKRLLGQIRRNPGRFPEDFVFQLTEEEFADLKTQNASSSWGGRRSRPYAFTFEGAIATSGVIKNAMADSVAVAVPRAVKQALAERNLLLDATASRLEALERDGTLTKKQIAVVMNELTSMQEGFDLWKTESLQATHSLAEAVDRLGGIRPRRELTS